MIAKATREFLGEKNVDKTLILTVLAVGIAIFMFTVIWSNFSAMVVINCIGSMVAITALLTPLKRSIKHQHSPAQKIVFFVMLCGVLVLLTRMMNHLIYPRVGGNFFEPSFADSLAVIFGATGPVLASIGFVLMCQERAYQKLQHLASLDNLTGILNRKAFAKKTNQLYEQTIPKKNPACLLLIDIDYFKNVNDTYGHQAGDTILKRTCQLISQSLGSNDIIGRMGGEEFMVLLSDTSLDTAHTLAKKILKRVQDTEFNYENNKIKITISIGIAARKTADNNYSQTLKRADLAMYEAKRSGRNRIVLG